MILYVNELELNETKFLKEANKDNSIVKWYIIYFNNLKFMGLKLYGSKLIR